MSSQTLELIDLFDRGVALDPGAPCLLRDDGSLTLSYGEVFELTHRIAVGLRDAGLDAGSRIGVLSPNDPIGFVAVLAVLRLGGVWIPLNVRSTADDLAALLDLCGADAVLCHEAVRDVGDRLGRDREVHSLGGGRPDDRQLERIMARSGSRLRRAPAPERLAALFGTGGTTGRPKAVMLGHAQLYAQSLGFLAHMPEPRPPVQLMLAPMTHAAGGITFPLLAVGGATVVHPGIVPERLFESLRAHRPTRLFLPPTAIYGLLDHPDVGAQDYSSLLYFLYAAAPMSPGRLRDAIDVFGAVMCQVYGQTEAPTICTYFGPDEHAHAATSPSAAHRLSSCGRQSVVAHVEVLGDDDRPLGPGERGEVVVRGPLVMDGYLGDASAPLRAGWHATGDIGYRDEDGYVYIVDREKDMIISGGFNVFPSEVEHVLRRHPAVRDCAVIGAPDDKWGEAVTAVVELAAGRVASEQELIALCRDRLGSVKAPKRVSFRELPRSPVGKVLKRALRDDYWRGRARQI